MVPQSKDNFKIEIFENVNFSLEITEFTFRRLLKSFLELHVLFHVQQGLYLLTKEQKIWLGTSGRED